MVIQYTYSLSRRPYWGCRVTIHPVPMDGTDGKVANEPSRVRVSVVEPSGTWTFGLGKIATFYS